MPAIEIISKFLDKQDESKHKDNETWGNSGDVKYHLGITYDKQYENGKNIRLTMLPNPSHLEAVNPVVYGHVRAIQDFEGDVNREKTMGILIHGDAALAG